MSITFTCEMHLPYDNIPQLKILIGEKDINKRCRMNIIKQKKGKRPRLKSLVIAADFNMESLRLVGQKVSH